MKNPYRTLGIGLAIGGALFTPIAFFLVISIPLTAVGLSSIMIGFTCITLSNARPYISPEACELILKTGMDNTASLLEELGLNSKAIYLPASFRNGKPQALVPLVDTKGSIILKGKINGRLIVRFGDNPDDMAIAITTPGSINLDKWMPKTSDTGGDIEGSVTYVLAGLLDIANGVTVNISETLIKVEVTGDKLHYEDTWYYRCLGSPIASIVASITSEIVNKPIKIIEEAYKNGKSTILLEIIS